MPITGSRALIGWATTYGPGTQIAPHAHDAHQVVHAVSGTMRVSADHRLWFVPPGRALWIPAGTEHGIACVGAVEMRTVYLGTGYPVPGDGVVQITVSDLLRAILVRLADRASPDLDPLLAEVLLAELATGRSSAASLPVPRDARLARMAAAMQSRPDSPKTLTAWARDLGFSERNLIRRIRSETGMSFRQFRRMTRIMVAVEKLSGGLSVTETAHDVGFETPSAFIHAFRHINGTTPRRFMAAWTNGAGKPQ